MKKRIKILLGILGVTTGILLLKNRNLNKKITELTAENQNNKDLIRGLHKAVERLSFNLGKEVGSKNN